MRFVRRIEIAAALAALTGLAGCLHGPNGGPTVKFEPPPVIRLVTPIGTLEFSFAKEEKRAVASAEQLTKQSGGSKDSLRFREVGFDTGPLPKECKPFERARYVHFATPSGDKALEVLRKKVEALRSETGVPDEAAIALAIYEADAFQSLCGPATAAKLRPGSRINGWELNEKAVQKFQAAGQGEIDVTPKIIITALSKDAFKGRLKPTAANVLLSKFRFEIPPNSETLAYEPKTGTTMVAYSLDLRDVALGNLTRSFYAGGILRIFVGKTHIYLVEFQTNTSGMADSVWDGYQKYLDSFTYVGEK